VRLIILHKIQDCFLKYADGNSAMLQTVINYTHAVIRFNFPILDKICHKGIYSS